MRTTKILLCVAGATLLVLGGTDLGAQTPAFTYQGRLFDGTNAVTGVYDLRFSLFDAEALGAQVGPSVAIGAVGVTNGLLTVGLDFGGAFDGSPRWLEIEERTNGAPTYTRLAPRQPVSAVPYATFAGSVPASGLAGTIPDSRLSTNVALLNSNLVFSGSIVAKSLAGNGAGITNISVPDQSITRAKLGADVQFARPAYLSGITSGLRPGRYAVRVLIDDLEQEPPPVLAAPYEEKYALIMVDPMHPSVVRPGEQTNSDLVLRRKVSQNNAWLRYRAEVVATNTPPQHKVLIQLVSENTELARWSFGGCIASGHSFRLADDGLPVEEIRFTFMPPVLRHVRQFAEVQPLRGSPQAGFASGLSASLRYEPWVNDTNLGGKCIIASDVSDTTPVASAFNANKDWVIVSQGWKTGVSPIILLQSPLAQTELFDWFASMSTQSDLRTLYLNVGDLRLIALGNAWPCSYKLMIGDDGLPYERFEFHCETASAP